MRRASLVALFVVSSFADACSDRPKVPADVDGAVLHDTSSGASPDRQLFEDHGLPEDWRRDGESPDTTPCVLGAAECCPGQTRWCDGIVSGTWGQVACGPDGRWMTTTTSGGTAALDCRDLADGRRPNTKCACYHPYFNQACCERPDCVLEPGETGQICPPSAGKLCDYCDPRSSECVEPGGLCIVTNSHETFCGRLCAPDNPCPTGFECLRVMQASGTTEQCIPTDRSCYY